MVAHHYRFITLALTKSPIIGNNTLSIALVELVHRPRAEEHEKVCHEEISVVSFTLTASFSLGRYSSVNRSEESRRKDFFSSTFILISRRPKCHLKANQRTSESRTKEQTSKYGTKVRDPCWF